MKCRSNLGHTEERRGRYQQAARHHYHSLAIARKTNDRYVECAALTNLGTVRLRLGDLQQAAGYLDQALALCREASNRYDQAEALTRTGDVRLRQGSPAEACDRIQEALALYQEIGDRSGEADALNSLGEALRAVGQPSRACTSHAAACDIASDIGDSYQQARAHHGLARAQHALARPDLARHHWGKALVLYTHLGTPEADQVRSQLPDTETGIAPGDRSALLSPRYPVNTMRSQEFLGLLSRPGRRSRRLRWGRCPLSWVLGQDRPQRSFAEDEHPVGDSVRAVSSNSFRISVGPLRQLRRVRITGTDVCW